MLEGEPIEKHIICIVPLVDGQVALYLCFESCTLILHILQLYDEACH